jgi:hypothetical protein
MRYFDIFLVIFLLALGFFNCVNYDTQPEVLITYPPNGSAVKDSIIIYAEATDNAEVTCVEFYINNTKVYTDSQYPYTFTWQITQEPGWMSIYAKAFDVKNKIGLSNLVNVLVLDTTDTNPPLVGIISPAAWSTVHDTVLIRAEASDNRGIAKLVFYIDGDSIGCDFDFPFQFRWNTYRYSDDYHSILVKAYDLGNNWANALITVKVDNDTTDYEPPQIAIVSPASWSRVSGTVLVRTEVSDNREIAKVVFYIDGDSVYTKLTPPFNYSWNTTTVSNDYHTILAKAYDRQGNWANSLVTVLVANK